MDLLIAGVTFTNPAEPPVHTFYRPLMFAGEGCPP